MKAFSCRTNKTMYVSPKFTLRFIWKFPYILSVYIGLLFSVISIYFINYKKYYIICIVYDYNSIFPISNLSHEYWY